MTKGTSRIGRVEDTQDGFALYQLELFTKGGESVSWVMLRAQMVDGQPDEVESEDILRVLRREASRRGYSVSGG
jgi:hypothetical protein